MSGIFRDANWDSNWEGETTRVCTVCGYRSPLQENQSVTDEPGCPACGEAHRSLLTETHASGWDENEQLRSAKLEVEIYSFDKPEGINMGWLKMEVDTFLKVLIDRGFDTASKLSGAPASEYIVCPPGGVDVTEASGTGPDANQGGTVGDTVGDVVRDFLDQIRGRRAAKARGVFIPWWEEEHKN